MSFGSSTSPRFKVAQGANPGPGTYHKDRVRTKSAPSAQPGQFSRSGWLRGTMETEQHNGLSREGFVGSQKELSSPGPGAYNSRSSFSSSQGPKQTGFLSEAERFHSTRPIGETPYRPHGDWSTRKGPQGQHGFNVSAQGSRAEWLHGEVNDMCAVRPAGYQNRQHMAETPGPGSYNTGSKGATGGRMSKQERFQQAQTNGRVGPGSYHRPSSASARRTPTPSATQLDRSNWLAGDVGGRQVVSGSSTHHVTRERMIETPGPGNYNHPSSFSRAMSRPQHQISLEERMRR